MKNVLQFLNDLSQNNNREWFTANKQRYNESKNKILFLTELLINEIRKFDPSIPQMDPKDCLFRIYRDVRFSGDKSPYKTNFGSFIAKGGKKSPFAGYYFHIDPEGSFAGGGIYMPQPDILNQIRSHIAENGAELLSIVEKSDFKKYYSEMFEDKLKTSPKGFPKDHRFIDLISYKSFVYSAPVKEELFANDNYIEYLLDSFRQLSPFNRFLNEIFVQ